MKHLEANLQEQCVHWFRLKFPKKIIFSTLNGARRIIYDGARLRRQGLTAGVSDLIIPEPTSSHHGLFVELKIKPNKVTKEQDSFLKQMLLRGYMACVCYSFDDFEKVAKDYFPEVRNFKIQLEYVGPEKFLTVKTLDHESKTLTIGEAGILT